MDKLKEELKDSFIKPLKIKFLVEKIRKEKEEMMKNSEMGVRGEGTV
jgi:hypothetical protein